MRDGGASQKKKRRGVPIVAMSEGRKVEGRHQTLDFGL